MSLIPTEHWDYSLADTARGLLTLLSVRSTGVDAEIFIPELGPSVPVRSARAGIVVALKALSLGEGASIAVPLYCCPVVLSAIKAAGHTARFIEVDPQTYCISADDLAAKSNEVDAVIAVHMFGNVCDMRALHQAAPGKPFVEDCAQALGSRIGDKVAGSFGEIAVFSFRSGKYISAGEGGAIYCSRGELKSRVSRLVNELAVPSRLEECVHIFKTYLRSLLRRKPLWGLAGNRLWSAYTEKVSVTSQAPVVMGQIFAADRATAVRRLSQSAICIERQRSNSEYYSRNLAVEANMLSLETTGTFFNRLQYPVLLQTSQQCDEVAVRLQKKQISTTRPYKDITAIATAHFGYTGDCPQAEHIAKTVLVIPCNYGLSASDLDRIATSVNEAWAELYNRTQDITEPRRATNDAVVPGAQNRESVSQQRHL